MKKKILVVGAGITGVSAAEWLRRDGWDVVLIDRVDSGDPAQASYGNAGLLATCAIVPVPVPGLLAKIPSMLLDPLSPLFMRWSYLPRLLPFLVPFLLSGRRKRLEEIVRAIHSLTRDCVEMHASLAAGTPAERFIQTGTYGFLYPNRKSYEDNALVNDLRRSYGMEANECNRIHIEEFDPHIGPDYQFAAVYKDHGWIRDPGSYVAALCAHFCSEGGIFRKADVVAVTSGEAPSVTLEGGEVITADKVVIATGAWSRKLADPLGNRVNLESERGYHLLLKNPNIKPPFPYMVSDGKFVTTPMDAGLRCAGIVEFAGLNAPAAKAPINLLKTRIRSVYPGLKYEAEETWLGHRPSTPDSLPMLGNASKAPGIIFAFGSQHIGLTIGPRLGRMVANIASARLNNIDMAPYAVNRFD